VECAEDEFEIEATVNEDNPCFVDISASCGNKEITLAPESILTVLCDDCIWDRDRPQEEYDVNVGGGINLDFDDTTARISANAKYEISYGAAESLYVVLDLVQEGLETTSISTEFPQLSKHTSIDNFIVYFILCS